MHLNETDREKQTHTPDRERNKRMAQKTTHDLVEYEMKRKSRKAMDEFFQQQRINTHTHIYIRMVSQLKFISTFRWFCSPFSRTWSHSVSSVPKTLDERKRIKRAMVIRESSFSHVELCSRNETKWKIRQGKWETDNESKKKHSNEQQQHRNLHRDGI